jgi:hypothetical protein
MASYIDNIFQNARIQDVQAFTPDWNFLAQGQAQLSATQKKNFADFAQRYNSIIDGDLTREDNVALRDQYKKNADEFVKQVAGADLTDPRNVKAAEAVFNPLVDNKMYIRDILNTRAVRDAQMKAQQQATSLNPAERDLYNENSLKQLNYFLQDFRTASPSEAVNMQAPSYLPGINLEKMALDFFNRQNYDVEIEQNTGQWIVKTKGGKLVEGNLRAGLLSEFYGDPLVRQNIALENQMQKRDFVEANLMNYNGDKIAAEAAFYQQKYSGEINFLEAESKKVIDQINEEVEVAETVTRELAKGENTDNVPLTDDALSVRDRLQKTAEQLKKLQQGIKQETNSVIATTTTKSKATAPYTLRINGKTYTPEQLDSLAFQNRVGTIANRLAMSRFSQTMEQNPYALEQFKKNLELRNKKEELLYKAQLDAMAAATTATSQEVDIPLPAQTQFNEDDPETIYAIKEKELNASASNVKVAENDIIKFYANRYPQDLKGKAINELNDRERSLIIKKATALKEAASLPAEAHKRLAGKLSQLDNYTSVYGSLSNEYRGNLRAAVVDGVQDEQARKTLLNIIDTTGADSLEELKAAYAKVRGVQLEKNAFLDARFNTISRLSYYASKLGVFDSYEEDAGEEFDKLMGSAFSFNKLVGKPTVANKFVELGKQTNTLGSKIGVGGIVPYAKSLGRATNIANTTADVVLSTAANQLVAGNAEYTTGEFTTNIKADQKDYKKVDGGLANAVRIMTDAVLQKQKENTGTLRGISVNVYQEGPNKPQYVHIIPDENTAKLITETSDKGKTSMTDDATINEMMSSGITLKFPAGSFPPNIIGTKKLTAAQQRFLLNNKISFGGNTTGDGGQMTITYNPGVNQLEVIGFRVDNGKTVPIGEYLEYTFNEEFKKLEARRNRGEAIDPLAEIVLQAENIYQGF